MMLLCSKLQNLNSSLYLMQLGLRQIMMLQELNTFCTWTSLQPLTSCSANVR